jgi:two-component system cell cycle response regulator CpdR
LRIQDVFLQKPEHMAHILIAEDDDQLRDFLVRGLKRAGHTVDPFPDGATALTQSRKAAYDLLLADIVMPELDGIELARRVSEEQPGIKIMFITGFAAVAMQDDSLGPNRPKVLAKPFHLRHLIDEIEHLLTQ